MLDLNSRRDIREFAGQRAVTSGRRVCRAVGHCETRNEQAIERQDRSDRVYGVFDRDKQYSR